MAILEFDIDPLEHLLDATKPPGNVHPLAATYPSINCIVYHDRVKKRWGYSSYRDLGTGEHCQYISSYQIQDATRYIMMLTKKDLCQVEAASGKTFSYKTKTGDYNTSDTKGVTGIVGAVVTFGASAALQTDGVAAGDKFVLDADLTSDEEPDTSWAAVLTVDSETQLTLTASYVGGASGDALVRQIYSVPTDERWQFAVFDNQFFFTNGDTHVQMYNGSGYASAIDSTNASRARYCVNYANRLLIADYYVSAVRNPWRLAFCSVADATDWVTAATGAGTIDFSGTEDFITGLGVAGTNIIVYKEDCYHLGRRTGNILNPISFASDRPGIGVFAPYSLVHFQGTNAFLWRNNFYRIEGTQPVSMGGRVAYDFFRLVEEANQKKVWGVNFARESQIGWVADTSDGRLVFVWDYVADEFGIYDFWNDIAGGGVG